MYLQNCVLQQQHYRLHLLLFQNMFPQLWKKKKKKYSELLVPEKSSVPLLVALRSALSAVSTWTQINKITHTHDEKKVCSITFQGKSWIHYAEDSALIENHNKQSVGWAEVWLRLICFSPPSLVAKPYQQCWNFKRSNWIICAAKKRRLKALDFYPSAEKWSFTAREQKTLLSFFVFFFCFAFFVGR